MKRPVPPEGWEYAPIGSRKPVGYMYWDVALARWIEGTMFGTAVERFPVIIIQKKETKVFNVGDNVEVIKEVALNRSNVKLQVGHAPESLVAGLRGKVESYDDGLILVDFKFASVWVKSDSLKQEKYPAAIPKFWRAKEGVRGLRSGAIVELVDARDFLYVRGSCSGNVVYEYCPKDSLEPLTVAPEVAAILEKAEKEINEMGRSEGAEMVSLMHRGVLISLETNTSLHGGTDVRIWIKEAPSYYDQWVEKTQLGMRPDDFARWARRVDALVKEFTEGGAP